jgi:predicted AlkP superfamily pyrophosphatase or phosphodiesterase
MTKYRSLLPAALAALLAACAADRAAAPADDVATPAVSRVVMVSVDGLRADALAHMPALGALLGRAAWSDSMLSVTPSLTVPGHLAMFTGRDVTQFGLVSNTLDRAAGATLVFNRASTVFQWVRGAGGHTAALVGASLVPEAQLADASEFFAIDEIVSVAATPAAIAAQAVAVATRSDAPALLFVHVPTVDFAGHDHGWIRTDTTAADGGDVLGVRYVEAVREADAAIGALWTALQPAVDRGEVALVVTADHGGGHGDGCTSGVEASREHCTANAADRAIPFVLLAKDATGRLAGRPTITQVAPTIARLMGIDVPPAAGTPLR